jgi:transcriptional regulator with XRE-family HTH domain
MALYMSMAPRYCDAVTQPSSPQRQRRGVGAEVRRYREMRKMSAQQLAERCAGLGLPIQRSVLANLENGRRDTVSTPELLVLALALNVAPVLLLFPAGRDESAELAPGLSVPMAEALQWFSGEAPLPAMAEDQAERWRDATLPAELFRVHAKDLADFQRVADTAARVAEDAAGTEAPERIEALTRIAVEQEALAALLQSGLRQMRAAMREAGLTPPALAPELAYIDEPGAGPFAATTARHPGWLTSRPEIARALARRRAVTAS